MADVNISKYRASVVRDGSKPASPGFVVSEGQDPVNPPGTNNFVPYTGATANVELGEFGVEAGFVTLDTTPTNTPTDQGTIYWDADDETVDVILNGYTMKIGEDLFYPVKNQTGSTIAKGTAVRFNGTVGASGRLLIAPFIADGSVPSSRFMGVTAEEILNGEDGKVLFFGRVRGINTNAFNEGDVLYASTTVAGGFQTAIPVAPNNIVLVAAVVTKSINQGTIFVRPTLGSNINTDEGVKITSPTTGDLLQLQAGGLWENKTVAQVIGTAYVPSTRTITINGIGLDLSTDRSWSVGDMLLNTYQVVTGTKVFGPARLIMEGEGTAQPTSLANTQQSNSALSSHNSFGFNSSNNIYFNKGTTANGGIFAFSNTATRTYTLKDASGTLAFTSDIPTNPVGGTGTTNYLPKFTGTSTIGNSQIFDNGTNVGIGTTGPNVKTEIADTTAIVALRVTTDNGGVSASNYSEIQLADNGAVRSYWRNVRDGSGATLFSYNDHLRFLASGTEAARLTATRNLLVGTTTDNGARLQVSGDGHFIGSSGFNRVRSTNTATTGFSGAAFEMYVHNGSSVTYSGGMFQTNSTFAYQQISANQTNIYGFQSGGMRLATGNAPIIFATGNSDLDFSTARMTITSSGNVGIGNAANGTGYAIEIARDANTPRIDLVDNGVYTGQLKSNSGIVTFQNSSANALVLGTSGSERMRITSGGNVLIGTTTDAGQRLQVSGTSYFTNNLLINTTDVPNNTTKGFGVGVDSLGTYIQNRVNTTASYGQLAFFNPNGLVGQVVTSGSSTSYVTSSDYRLKTDLKDYNGLDLVNKIKTYDFAWKTDKSRSFGVIAHELQEVIEYAVTGKKDGQITQGVDYSKLVPIMVKAIQELKQEIDTLKK